MSDSATYDSTVDRETGLASKTFFHRYLDTEINAKNRSKKEIHVFYARFGKDNECKIPDFADLLKENKTAFECPARYDAGSLVALVVDPKSSELSSLDKQLTDAGVFTGLAKHSNGQSAEEMMANIIASYVE